MITAGEFLERFRAREWVLDIGFLWFMWIVTKVVFWFMALHEPNAAQSMFVSVVVGILAVLTAIYGQMRSRT